jgi:hypothetical protein
VVDLETIQFGLTNDNLYLRVNEDDSGVSVIATYLTKDEVLTGNKVFIQY